MIFNRKNILIGLFGVSFFAGCLIWSYTKGQDDIQAKWDKYALEQAQEYIKATQEAARKQSQLNLDIEQLRAKHDTVTKELRGTVANLNDRLRKRPQRPATYNRVPEATSVKSDPPGCTGKQLYQEDGRFLIGESERADTIRSLLIECRSAYDSLVN